MGSRHILVALGVHAAAIAALWLVPVHPLPPPPPPEPLVELSDLEPPPPADEPRTGAAAAEATGERVAARSLVPPRTNLPEPVSPENHVETPPQTPDLVLPGTKSEGTVDLGLARKEGLNPFLPKSEAAVALAESKRQVDRALKDPARERETELGLGPEGPVLRALGEATGRSTAPVRGRAVFVATANEDGVFALELRDAEGSRAGWDDARTIALAALRGKKLRLPPRTTRAVMRIEVTSAWKLPSGQDPGTNVNLFHLPIAKGEGKDSATVDILDPIPKIRIVEIPLDQNTKIPVVTFQIDLFSASTDPSNIGAKPRRIVHSHLLDSQVM